MKPIKRKLSLDTHTLRNLSTDELGRVVGGVSSHVQGMCSTWGDTGCVPSANDVCQSVQNCVTNGCATNPC